MATIQIAARPASLDGCFQTWSEHDMAMTVRSEMDLSGYVKVRRRTTQAAMQVEAGVTLPATDYDAFILWYRVNCGGGTFPTRVKRPDGREIIMRFAEPPVFEWPESNKDVVHVACVLEAMPAWRDLT